MGRRTTAGGGLHGRQSRASTFLLSVEGQRLPRHAERTAAGAHPLSHHGECGARGREAARTAASTKLAAVIGHGVTDFISLQGAFGRTPDLVKSINTVPHFVLGRAHGGVSHCDKCAYDAAIATTYNNPITSFSLDHNIHHCPPACPPSFRSHSGFKLLFISPRSRRQDCRQDCGKRRRQDRRTRPS